jgi:uncharacterized membrane protein YagU involved in acid resistance
MPRGSPDSPAIWQHPVWVLILGLGGFLAGVGLLLLGAFRTERSEAFVRSAAFAVWATTIGVQTAFWVVVAGPLWRDLGTVWRRARLGRSAMVALAAALLLILVVFPVFSLAAKIPWPLWGQQLKTRALTIIGGVLVGVPALSGIGLVQQQVRRRETEPIDDEDVRAALEARAQMLRFLSMAGAVIGLAVLAAGALRQATVPKFVLERDFPQEGILLYGAFFTGLLLLVYVPAHQALKRLGLRIRDHYFPLSLMPDPDADSFKGWLDRRTTLETLLQLNVTPTQQLQASLFILAPLLSSVITSLVPRPG